MLGTHKEQKWETGHVSSILIRPSCPPARRAYHTRLDKSSLLADAEKIVVKHSHSLVLVCGVRQCAHQCHRLCHPVSFLDQDSVGQTPIKTSRHIPKIRGFCGAGCRAPRQRSRGVYVAYNTWARRVTVQYSVYLCCVIPQDLSGAKV